jgi:hypothetical protein
LAPPERRAIDSAIRPDLALHTHSDALQVPREDDLELDSPSEREIARQERMKREG